MNIRLKINATALAAGIAFAMTSGMASADGAFDLEAELRSLQPQATSPAQLAATKDDGKTLAEAIEQVRRQTGGRIVSAETRVRGGREVHYIKVLTKDGKVKTRTVNGKSRR